MAVILTGMQSEMEVKVPGTSDQGTRSTCIELHGDPHPRDSIALSPLPLPRTFQALNSPIGRRESVHFSEAAGTEAGAVEGNFHFV